MLYSTSQPVFNNKARIHVFIGIDESRENSSAYDICRYSIESNTSSELSFIPVRKDLKLTVLDICFKFKLYGFAVYLDESFLIRGDIQEMIDGLHKGRFMIWCAKHTPDPVDWSDLIVYDLQYPILYKKIKGIYKRSTWYSFISVSKKYVNEEVGPIPLAWKYTPVPHTKPVLDLSKIKGIFFEQEKPWVNPRTKLGIEWWKEYNLFLINVVQPLVKSACNPFKSELK